MNRRTLALAAAIATTLAGAQAFAQTTVDQDSGTVTVAAVGAGSRSLALTGATGTGTASLALSDTGTPAPFGVQVSDVAYQRTPYQVNATLSNVHLLVGGTTPSCDGTQAIPATDFSVGFAGTPPSLTGVKALLEPTIAFTGSVVGGLLDGAALTVDYSPSLPVPTTTSVGLMTVADGTGGAWTAAAPNPECTSETGQSGSGDSVVLQTGTPATLDATALTQLGADLMDIGNADDTLTPTELAGADPSLAGINDPLVGELWLATQTALSLLPGIGTLTDQVVTDTLAGLTATTATALTAADVVGQTGVYLNVPQLELAAANVPSTGFYRGTLTVTLVE